MNCPICSSSMSEPVQELFSLPSVASDCRPWSKGRSVQICSGCGVMKRVTSDTFNPDVYKYYTSYPEPTGRTKNILEFVINKISEPESVLDVGCGKSDGLRVLAGHFPKAEVYGYEPTLGQERTIGKFDLITLFHVFEHVEDLHEMLSYIKSSLTENGHVLIQVPYTRMWPFDLVIADHEWHFNMNSLTILLDKSGFTTVFIGNDIIKKEITLLARVGEPNLHPIFYESSNSIGWLLDFKNKLDTINEPIAVYGTSVSAMWTGNVLGDKVQFYIDDDSNRQQKIFNGKRVATPFQCDLPIVAPFPDWQLAEIKAKNPSLRIV